MNLPFDDDAAALGQILGSIPEIIIVVDGEGTMRYLNRVEPGYVRDDLIGAPALSVVFPDSRPVHQAVYDRVMSTGESDEYESEVTLPDGTQAWYGCRMFPFREGGEVTGAVILATNITELKAAQSEVARLKRLLPICSWCDRIQNEDGSWETIETYLGAHMDTMVTHGMCPECYGREVDSQG